MLLAALAVSFPVASASAQDAPLSVRSIEDVHAALDGGTASSEIVAAIESSSTEWLPRHLYELVDREAPDDVKRALATKASTFYSGSEQSLAAQSKAARGNMAPSKKKLRGADVVILFEFFMDIKHEVDAASQSVPALAPKASGELDREFDVRKRKHDEAVVRATAPIQGKIDTTSFDLEWAGTWEPLNPSTGCTRAKAILDVNHVDFFAFREGMGTLKSRSDVQVKTKTVEAMSFESGGTRRIEATSKPVCAVSESTYKSLQSSGVKLWVEMSRTWEGGDWSGPAEFVNARTNQKITITR